MFSPHERPGVAVAAWGSLPVSCGVKDYVMTKICAPPCSFLVISALYHAFPAVLWCGWVFEGVVKGREAGNGRDIGEIKLDQVGLEDFLQDMFLKVVISH